MFIKVSEHMVPKHKVDLFPVLRDHRLLVEVDMLLLDVVRAAKLVKD